MAKTKFVISEKVGFATFFRNTFKVTPDLTALIGETPYVPAKPKPAEIFGVETSGCRSFRVFQRSQFVFLITCFLALVSPGVTRAATADQLIKEGVALHDQGQYDAAIAKYKQVLEGQPNNVVALHEMSYSYYMKKDFNHSLEAALKGAQFKTAYLPVFYEMIGNCYDELNQPDKSFAAYKQGVALDPQNERLLYNLALAYRNAGQWEAALERLKHCAFLNPKHSSPHLVLGSIYSQHGFRIPAVLALCRFLTLEPATSRSAGALAELEKLLRGGVTTDSKTGNINVTVDDESKSPEGDFGDLSLLLSLSTATEKTAESKVLPEAQWRLMNFEALFSALGSPDHAKDTHFVYAYYRPYFADLKKQGLVETFGYYIYQSGQSQEISDWLKAHPAEVKKFLAWSESYSLKK